MRPPPTPGARPGFIVTALVVMVGMFLAGLAALWLIWASAFWVLDRAVDWVPAEWEAQFGKQALAEMDNHGIADPTLRASVQGIEDRLTAQLPKDTPYKFTITPVWSKEANAFALPGGQMLVTSQLLAESATPDEVAGVLGHEIAHVIHRHGFRAMAREVGLSLVIALVLGDGSTLATIARGGTYLAGLGNSRGNELQADTTGIKLAYEAGFQPRGIGDFFRRQQQEAKLGETTERALAFLSTHPANADRLANLDKLAAAFPARARSDFRSPSAWAEVRRLAAAIPADVVEHDKQKKEE